MVGGRNGYKAAVRVFESGACRSGAVGCPTAHCCACTDALGISASRVCRFEFTWQPQRRSNVFFTCFLYGVSIPLVVTLFKTHTQTILKTHTLAIPEATS